MLAKRNTTLREMTNLQKDRRFAYLPSGDDQAERRLDISMCLIDQAGTDPSTGCVAGGGALGASGAVIGTAAAVPTSAAGAALGASTVTTTTTAGWFGTSIGASATTTTTVVGSRVALLAVGGTVAVAATVAMVGYGVYRYHQNCHEDKKKDMEAKEALKQLQCIPVAKGSVQISGSVKNALHNAETREGIVQGIRKAERADCSSGSCLLFQKGDLSQIKDTVEKLDAKVPKQVRESTAFRTLQGEVSQMSTSGSSRAMGEQLRNSEDGTIWLFSKAMVERGQVVLGFSYLATSEKLSQDQAIGFLIHHKVFVKDDDGDIFLGVPKRVDC